MNGKFTGLSIYMAALEKAENDFLVASFSVTVDFLVAGETAYYLFGGFLVIGDDIVLLRMIRLVVPRV